MRYEVKMDSAQKIMIKRHLEKGGKAQRFLISEYRKAMDRYVPFLSGTLKNTAQEQKDGILYVSPYSRKQFNENKGRGLRGKKWNVRAWADRGKMIIKSVSNFVGGE